MFVFTESLNFWNEDPRRRQPIPPDNGGQAHIAAAFMPDVPEASIGRNGVFIQTSTPDSHVQPAVGTYDITVIQIFELETVS